MKDSHPDTEPVQFKQDHPPLNPKFPSNYERTILHLARALCLAWKRYEKLFGEVPHGTDKQMAALLELAPEFKEVSCDPLVAYKLRRLECIDTAVSESAKWEIKYNTGIDSIKAGSTCCIHGNEPFECALCGFRG